MIVLLIIIFVLIAAYIMSLMCRSGHPGWEQLQGWSYAHRGLHGDGIPENSMKAFRKAKEAGYGIELDIHLLADGNLAVIHDSSLKRVAGADVLIEDLTTEQLDQYYLEGTFETIPEFKKVLDLFNGEAPLIVELKVARDNYAALSETACRMLQAYNGPYCLESFDPRCIRWLKKNRPQLIRGQLAENYLKTPGGKLPWLLKFLLSYHLMSFLFTPDFIAHKYSDRKTLSNWICRKLWKARGVTWTLKSQREFDAAVKDGWIPIFEGFRP